MSNLLSRRKFLSHARHGSLAPWLACLASGNNFL